MQYTITVLPSFLIPYSRVLFDKVIEAVDDHLVNGKTQSESLDKMGCINILTFRLHFSRVIKLLPEWIELLSRWIIDLGDSIKNQTLSETFPSDKGIKKNCLRWNQFKELLELFVVSYNRIPKTGIILKPFYFQFVHARFVLNGMPLGP